jgi:AhpD family alkylhydroperoxidase
METVTVSLKELCPEIHDGLERIRSVAFRDGRIAGKEKLLMALAIAASVKCEPCIRMYAEKASRAGATLEEAAEILSVTMALGGCVGEAWTQKALVALENSNRKRPVPVAASGDACCAV